MRCSNDKMFEKICVILDKIRMVFSNKVQKRLGYQWNDTDLKYYEKQINY